jgi:hypothetical protein
MLIPSRSAAFYVSSASGSPPPSPRPSALFSFPPRAYCPRPVLLFLPLDRIFQSYSSLSLLTLLPTAPPLCRSLAPPLALPFVQYQHTPPLVAIHPSVHLEARAHDTIQHIRVRAHVQTGMCITRPLIFTLPYLYTYFLVILCTRVHASTHFLPRVFISVAIKCPRTPTVHFTVRLVFLNFFSILFLHSCKHKCILTHTHARARACAIVQAPCCSRSKPRLYVRSLHTEIF